jgi:hypothetical protein
VVGVSVGYGPTPALDAQRVTTAALPGLDESTLRPGDPDLAQLWRAAYVAMATKTGSTPRGEPRLEATPGRYGWVRS